MEMQGPRRLLLIVAAVAVVAAACSAGKGGSSAAPSASTAGSSTTASASTVAAQQASTVSVHMKEFSLAPQPSSDPAGKVTFKAVNDGKVTHELVVLNTDRAPGALPVAKGKADETGDLGEAEDIAAGSSKSVTLALKPGHYVLICNLAGHYQAGMHAAFTVR
jgi:uncharacterized cupredoxin-like copper-binding protein